MSESPDPGPRHEPLGVTGGRLARWFGIASIPCAIVICPGFLLGGAGLVLSLVALRGRDPGVRGAARMGFTTSLAGLLLSVVALAVVTWRQYEPPSPFPAGLDLSHLLPPRPPPDADVDVAAHRRALPALLEGRVALNEGRHDDAITALSRAVEGSPAFGQALYYRGLARMLSRDADGAVLDLVNAVRADKLTYSNAVGFAGSYGSRYADPYDALAWSRPAQKTELALEELEAAVARDADWLGRSMRRDVLDDPRDRGRIERVLESDPANAVLHYKLAVILNVGGDTEPALVHAERAIELAPGLAPAFVLRGRLLDGMGRHAEAIAAYDAAIGAGLPVAAVFLDRGDARFAAGDPVGAIADWEAGTDADHPGYDEPRRALLQSRKALAHNELGHRVQAMVYLRRASRAVPGHVDDLDPRPVDQHPLDPRHGPASATEERYREQVRTRPHDPVPRFLLAGVLRRAGRLDEAGALLSEAIDLDPLFLLPRIHRARVRAALGDAQGARRDLDSVLDEDSGWLLARVERGALHEAAGRLTAALEDYAFASNQRPGWVRAAAGRARLFVSTGRPGEALVSLTTEELLRSHDPALHEARATVWDALDEPATARADRLLALAGYEARGDAEAEAAKRVRTALGDR